MWWHLSGFLVSNYKKLILNHLHIGGYASYLLPVAALVAMGFCYMWCKVRLLSHLKIIYISAVELEIEVVCNNAINAVIIFLSIIQGWSFSDVMSVTKQLENVNEKVDVSCIC